MSVPEGAKNEQTPEQIKQALEQIEKGGRKTYRHDTRRRRLELKKKGGTGEE